MNFNRTINWTGRFGFGLFWILIGIIEFAAPNQRGYWWAVYFGVGVVVITLSILGYLRDRQNKVPTTPNGRSSVRKPGVDRGPS